MRFRWPSLVLCLVLACASSKKDVKTDVASPAQPATTESFTEHKGANPGETVKELDSLRSGKTNVWKYTKKGDDGRDHLVRKELDLNGDGKVDVWKYYDDKEQLIKEALDLDYDGHVDQVDYFENGQLVRKEKDPRLRGPARSCGFITRRARLSGRSATPRATARSTTGSTGPTAPLTASARTSTETALSIAGPRSNRPGAEPAHPPTAPGTC